MVRASRYVTSPKLRPICHLIPQILKLSVFVHPQRKPPPLDLPHDTSASSCPPQSPHETDLPHEKKYSVATHGHSASTSIISEPLLQFFFEKEINIITIILWKNGMR